MCDTYPYNVKVDNNHVVSYVIHIQIFIKIQKIVNKVILV